MQKRLLKTLSIALFILGIALIIHPFSLTGATIGPPKGNTEPAGTLLLLTSLLIAQTEEEDLEKKLHRWKRFEVRKDSQLADIEQHYLMETEAKERTPLQETIERTTTGGKLIQDQRANKRRSYQEQ